MTAGREYAINEAEIQNTVPGDRDTHWGYQDGSRGGYAGINSETACLGWGWGDPVPPARCPWQQKLSARSRWGATWQQSQRQHRGPCLEHWSRIRDLQIGYGLVTQPVLFSLQIQPNLDLHVYRLIDIASPTYWPNEQPEIDKIISIQDITIDITTISVKIKDELLKDELFCFPIIVSPDPNGDFSHATIRPQARTREKYLYQSRIMFCLFRRFADKTVHGFQLLLIGLGGGGRF